MNPLLSQLIGTSCRQVTLLPKFLSRKKLSRKYRSIFASKISLATGVRSKNVIRNSQKNEKEKWNGKKNWKKK